MNTLTLSILQFFLVMLGTFILLYSRQKLITEIASLKLKMSIIKRDDITFRSRIKREIMEDRDRRSEAYSTYKAWYAREIYILRVENANLRKSKLDAGASIDEEAFAYGRAWQEHEINILRVENADLRKSNLETSLNEEAGACAYCGAWNEHEINILRIEKGDIRKSNQDDIKE